MKETKKMENYIVSARKYRPATFGSVIGQRSLTTTLKNAIASGKLAHAYLFCGPRGVGKTTCARIFAKTINCLHPTPEGEACNECESCKAFNEQRSYSIRELDAASNNSVEDIRSLIDQIQTPPQVGKYKVYIIDEVHMLSSAAFNAFLKTLEEPPAYAIFILATTEKHKILPTILSRCQVYDFNRMEVPDIVAHLENVARKEGYAYETDALNVIARKADGGMRDALSIFDQVASFTEGDITYKKVIEDLNELDYEYYFSVTDALLAGNVPQLLLTFNEVLGKGFEGNLFIGGLASHLRDLLVSKDAATLQLLDVADSVKERYRQQAARCTPKFIYKALRLCNNCDASYRDSRNKRLLVELTLIEVAQLSEGEDPPSGLGPAKTLKPLFSKPVEAPSSPQSAPVAPQLRNVAEPSAPASGSAAPSAPHREVSVHENPVSSQQLVAAAPVRPAVGKFTRTISIRNAATSPKASLAAEEKTASQPPAPQTLEETPFDERALTYQWYRFAAQLPQEKTAIAARMKGMKPNILDNAVVEVPVENEQVKEYMSALQEELTRFLRQNLKNGKLTLRFRLLEAHEQTRAYSRREQFAAMLQKSPELSQLQKLLQLELA